MEFISAPSWWWWWEQLQQDSLQKGFFHKIWLVIPFYLSSMEKTEKINDKPNITANIVHALSGLAIVLIESFILYHVPSIHSLCFAFRSIGMAVRIFVSNFFKSMHTIHSGILEWISHHIWQFLFCQFCLLRSVSMNLTWQCLLV